MLKTAIKAARDAGQVLTRYYTSKLTIKTKSTDRDLVTEADIEAERVILSVIAASFPDHAIVAEESGSTGHSAYTWLVDPLDGTNNFAHGHPVFCVALALLHLDKVVLSVIFDPLRDELFTAEKGQGAFLNGESIRVSDCQDLTASIIATGFPYDRATNPQNNLAEFNRMMPLVQGVRRCGSAALDMAYVACGRIDGYWEHHLNPWDYLGGALMVTEAGGTVSNMQGEACTLETRSVVAGTPRIYTQILDIIRQ